MEQRKYAFSVFSSETRASGGEFHDWGTVAPQTILVENLQISRRYPELERGRFRVATCKAAMELTLEKQIRGLGALLEDSRAMVLSNLLKSPMGSVTSKRNVTFSISFHRKSLFNRTELFQGQSPGSIVVISQGYYSQISVV